MSRTVAQQKLLDTGKYEEYVDPSGITQVRKKTEYGTRIGDNGEVWQEQTVYAPERRGTSGRFVDSEGNDIPYEEYLRRTEPIDPLAEYRKQIDALSTETDPDYNENLEQLSPEEMDEEIL